MKTLQQLSLFAVPTDPYQARVDAALLSSLHSFSDPDKRWSKHQKRGLTDAELKEADSWCGAFAALVEDIRVERYFTAQFDQLDSDVQLIMEEEVDEAIAQVAIAQLKSARAALALQTEGDRLAREALAFVVDQVIVFAMVKPQPVVEVAVVDALATSLEVPGADGVPKRERKASTSRRGATAK